MLILKALAAMVLVILVAGTGLVGFFLVKFALIPLLFCTCAVIAIALVFAGIKNLFGKRDAKL